MCPLTSTLPSTSNSLLIPYTPVIFCLAVLPIARPHIVDPLRLPTRLVFRPIFRIWAVLLLLAVGLAVYHGWHNLGVPFNLDYGEGPLICQPANILTPLRPSPSPVSGPLVI